MFNRFKLIKLISIGAKKAWQSSTFCTQQASVKNLCTLASVHFKQLYIFITQISFKTKLHQIL